MKRKRCHISFLIRMPLWPRPFFGKSIKLTPPLFDSLSDGPDPDTKPILIYQHLSAGNFAGNSLKFLVWDFRHACLNYSLLCQRGQQPRELWCSTFLEDNSLLSLSPRVLKSQNWSLLGAICHWLHLKLEFSPRNNFKNRPQIWSNYTFMSW